jgi:uncharacterized membrane protein YqjE
MPASNGTHRPLSATSRHFGHLLLTIGENRLELLTLELQEERDRFLQAILYAMATVAVGLLGGGTLTAALVVILWPYTHVGALLGLTVIYGIGGYALSRRVIGLLHQQPLPATVEQLRKDRACLAKIFA